ncbi:olfactory receptor 8K5-like [Bos javanicus]|uniref:olfactory receptor 8K5-like n=1 Tax=Bos javanicus TaxID=9906 RepID=UPI002AA643A2|nr:olfactory receptor 8K5-like [Bos javanicus]
MDQQNRSSLTEFILMGVTKQPELQTPLFGAFLIIYTITVVGNLGMIILTQVDSRLHTPMYFFIKHLAFIDLGNSTVICPKMLVNFVVDQNTISYYACATQLAFFLMFIISEFFILSAMAYDRYLAICNPLLYHVIMSQRLCHMLVGIPYLYGTFQALMFTIKIFTLTFCGSNVISHFYCDDVPLLLMLCSNAQEIELLIILFSAFNLISSLLVILMSYILILTVIFQMRSAESRKKAFSTCGSHLMVVVVFYGSLLFMYMQPNSTHSFDTDKMASVFYTLVIPMLNPFIYSLRNKEVNSAFQMVLKNKCKLCI